MALMLDPGSIQAQSCSITPTRVASGRAQSSQLQLKLPTQAAEWLPADDKRATPDNLDKLSFHGSIKRSGIVDTGPKRGLIMTASEHPSFFGELTTIWQHYHPNSNYKAKILVFRNRLGAALNRQSPRGNLLPQSLKERST
jgi:hypothetical protein